MKLIDQMRIEQARAPEEPEEIFDRLREENIDGQDLANLLGRYKDWPVYHPSQYSSPDSRGNDWLITDDIAFVLNPFSRTIHKINDNHRGEFHRYGILPIDAVEESAESAEGSQTKADELLHEIMDIAIKRGASDVHIDPYTDTKVRVFFRINSQRISLKEMPNDGTYRLLANIILSKAGQEAGTYIKPLDGQFRWSLSSRDISIRMAMTPVAIGDKNHPKFTLRLLGLQLDLQEIDRLGFSGEDVDRLKHMSTLANGLNIITGPTSSGKTNTLYAALREAYYKRPDKSYFTLEDPVEIEFQHFLGGVAEVNGYGYQPGDA